MDINQIKSNQDGVDVSGKIIEMGEIRTFTRLGDPGRVAIAVLEDKTGKIDLTLWDDETELFKKGDSVLVTGGKAKEFRGIKQLSSGKKGNITKL